mgnify:CR=1 FL=1
MSDLHVVDDVHGIICTEIPVCAARTLLRDILSAQAEKGLSKYGTPLLYLQGISFLPHALEEAVDLACYLQAEDPAYWEREIVEVLRLGWQLAEAWLSRATKKETTHDPA